MKCTDFKLNLQSVYLKQEQWSSLIVKNNTDVHKWSWRCVLFAVT
jgi:hypothetical protein